MTARLIRNVGQQENMESLTAIFDQFDVALWAAAPLSRAVPGACESYVVFCLPYFRPAVADLPSDSQMNECKARLGEITKRIYKAIAEAHPMISWSYYDKMNETYHLRSNGISQKVLAHLAGLGWIGRSNLLVTRAHGAQVRIGTIFTSTDLEATASPSEDSCGSCQACIPVCPAAAISISRYDVSACRTVVCDSKGDYRTFCGLCMQACSKATAQAAQQVARADAASPRHSA